MTSRSAVAGVLLAGALLCEPSVALAQDASATTRRGAVVVAIGEESAGAARVLARDVYRDAALRPGIDDATARVLAGEAPAPDAPARLLDLAKARAALGTTAQDDGTTRRSLTGIGAELGAELVAVVEMRSGKPVARALLVGKAQFAGVELFATVTGDPPDSTIEWAGAVPVLRSLLEPRATTAPRAAGAPTAKPVAPPPPPRPADKGAHKSVFSSPFFWGSLGAVAAVGLGIFVAARVSDDADDTFLVQGKVPR